jgi:hypothetical protein
MGITKGNLPTVKVAAAATPTNVVEHINNIDLKFDGKSVDVTEFAASAPVYVARAPGIKDVTATISGFLEKGATGQAFFWANMVSDADLYVKVLLTATTPAVEFKAVVDSIETKVAVDGYVEVTYNVSNASSSAVVIT